MSGIWPERTIGLPAELRYADVEDAVRGLAGSDNRLGGPVNLDSHGRVRLLALVVVGGDGVAAGGLLCMRVTYEQGGKLLRLAIVSLPAATGRLLESIMPDQVGALLDRDVAHLRAALGLA